MQKSEIRKKLAERRRQGKLQLNDATLVNNSIADTMNKLEEDISQCVDWQDRHPDRVITPSELSSSLKLPNAEYLAMIFGSVPNFLGFFYGA